MLVRAAKLGLDLQAHIKTGLGTVRQVDPAQIVPGEFAHIIRKEVEENGARLLVIRQFDRIREYRIDTHGLRIGEPLTMFRGVLTGTPTYTGDIDPLLEERGANRT
jgi:hypothetical protein